MPDRTRLRTTWDGLFISEEPPHGVTVIVRRRDRAGEVEFLVLHRRHGRRGDWEWGPPSGVRLPGEDVDACARRELDASTGLHLPLHRVPHEPAWAVYWAEATPATTVSVSGDHDRHEWVGLDEAMQRCRPRIVAEQFELLAGAVAA